MKVLVRIVILGIFLASCQPKEEASQLFMEKSASETGVDFENNLPYTEELNPYTYKSFYNGGGVGIGDINNDGLVDLFFCGNRESNKLYLNKGDFRFEDVTLLAGLETEDVWSTGVSFVDINQDGHMDIYVCKSGPPDGNERFNSLYINDGKLNFTDRAVEYGLDNKGLSVHAAFFDYDRDGDLDCYLLNNSIRSVGGYDLREHQRTVVDSIGGNKLLKNSDGFFEDVSLDAGIYSSEIGFGLGVSIADINKDNWPDIYVSNDFFERDYLYLNNKDGTFSETLVSFIKELSMGSMGADMADINNDGLLEIFVTEMLPERHDRLMSKAMFESWDKYELAVDQGYYHQFSRNVLQLNNGNDSFSEISRLAGVEATDWSWGALIFDMDNDGWKDIFVANGIFKDLLDQDYINFMATPDAIRSLMREEGSAIDKLVEMMPSEAIPNYFFKNNQDLTFSDYSNTWAKGGPSFSNGSAYADLDNDGDLDLVLNNLNSKAQIFENTTRSQSTDGSSYLTVHLQADQPNRDAIGSKVILEHDGRIYYQELSPMRGFQSSVDYRLLFGLDTLRSIDMLTVIWQDGTEQRIDNVATNQLLEIRKDVSASDKSNEDAENGSHDQLFVIDSTLFVEPFRHTENNFVDFDRNRLLVNMRSNEGPCLCTGDVNGDEYDDLYIGGGKEQSGRLYTQWADGSLHLSKTFDEESSSEDVNCVFFDADNDGSLDLYVVSGGSEFSTVSSALRDRLYLNKKSGWVPLDQVLPAGRFESTSVAVPLDFDRDGDMDLFIGGRMVAGRYGTPTSSYLLENDGTGKYVDATSTKAPMLSKIGMVTDAVASDLNGDKVDDLVIVGEWMGIHVLINEAGQFVDRSTQYGFLNQNGWYHTVETADLNNDGQPDIIVGNHGLNTRWDASPQKPITMFINDFDRNGDLDHLPAMYYGESLYPMVQLKELSMQIPGLKKEFLKFNSYKDKTVDQIFGKEILEKSIRLEAHTLATSLWLSSDTGTYVKATLPIQAQISPVFAIQIDDFNQDGIQDMLLAGNQLKVKPEFGGHHANYGVLMLGKGNGEFELSNYNHSGLFVEGEVRNISELKTIDGSKYLIFARSDRSPYVVKQNVKVNE